DQGYRSNDQRLSRGELDGSHVIFVTLMRLPPGSTLFPYTTLFRSEVVRRVAADQAALAPVIGQADLVDGPAVLHLQRPDADEGRSEEHTPELQSRGQLVCRLLLEHIQRVMLQRPGRTFDFTWQAHA